MVNSGCMNSTMECKNASECLHERLGRKFLGGQPIKGSQLRGSVKVKSRTAEGCYVMTSGRWLRTAPCDNENLVSQWMTLFWNLI